MGTEAVGQSNNREFVFLKNLERGAEETMSILAGVGRNFNEERGKDIQVFSTGIEAVADAASRNIGAVGKFSGKAAPIAGALPDIVHALGAYSDGDFSSTKNDFEFLKRASKSAVVTGATTAASSWALGALGVTATGFTAAAAIPVMAGLAAGAGAYYVSTHGWDGASEALSKGIELAKPLANKALGKASEMYNGTKVKKAYEFTKPKVIEAYETTKDFAKTSVEKTKSFVSNTFGRLFS